MGAVTTYSYDASGRMVSRVDPRGNVSGADPNLFRWSFAYDPTGRMVSQTDPAGRVTTFGYDVIGRTVSVTAPDGRPRRCSTRTGT